MDFLKKKFQVVPTESTSETTEIIKKKKGLGIVGTSLILVGEMAGTGAMALPYIMDKTGIAGVMIISSMCLLCPITGVILARSWLIVQDRYDEYKGHVRHPYPTIAFVSFGKAGRVLLSCCSNFSMFSACVVILFIAAENISNLLFTLFDVNLPTCYVMIIVNAVLLPLSWLGTPKDFWFIGVVATCSSALAFMLLLAAIIADAYGPYKHTKVHHSGIEVLPFFQAMGAITYMTGGHYAFPTVQNDMKNPEDFRWSLVLTYIMILFLYLPLAVGGYLVYGNAVAPNVLLTLQTGALSNLIQVLVTMHTMAAMIININPLLQHAEEAVRLSHEISWKQFVLRSAIFLSVLIVGLIAPNFNVVLSLAGGSVNNFLSFLFPCVFYLKLLHMEGAWPKLAIPFYVKVFSVEVISVAILIAVLSTVGNMKSVLQGNFYSFPCVLNMTHGG